MAARIIANLIIAGGGVLIRAAAQAYRQALINGQRAGVQADKVRGTTQMTLDEAQKILDVHPGASLAEMRRKYQHLFQVNEAQGSFYLQSKVVRAKERLQQELEEQGIQWVDQDPASSQQDDKQQEPQKRL